MQATSSEPATRFPPVEDLVAGVTSDYERWFVEHEFAPGLDYYLARVDRLGLSGDVVLDAGCGAGQWSLALARRFRRVEAIDLNAGRLGVLGRVAARMGVRNITPRRASIERLPLADRSVDAVLCYGVIMFTDVPRVLAEFHRVLRPGGRVYVVLNADGWSRFLTDRRGAGDPKMREVGEETIYSTAWRRALPRGIARLVRTGFNEWWYSPFREALERARAERAQGRPALARDIGRILVNACAPGEDIVYQVRNHCPRLTERLHDDAFAVASDGLEAPAGLSAARAWLPDEVEPIAATAGFVGFQWAAEAGLECAWPAPPAPPRYDALQDGQLCVWEFVATRPAPITAVAFPERHLRAARAARLAGPAFIEPSAAPLVANRSMTLPRADLDRAAELARGLGGDGYLRELARRIVGEATGEAALRRLLAFARGAIVRDPVAQPLAPDFGLPDPLVALLTARGRCGHCAALIVALARHAGLEARVRQLPRHVVAEVEVEDGRWALADADAYKHADPEGPGGRLPTWTDVQADPFLLDRLPASGWVVLPGLGLARGALGTPVRGYVDAAEPHDRGFVSGNYLPKVFARPPTLPRLLSFERRGRRAVLEWAPSRCDGGRVVGYRVAVGSRSRGWSWAEPGEVDLLVAPLPQDLASEQVAATRFELEVPDGPVYASVTALSDRVERDPATFFWPSEEARLGP